MIHAFLVSVFLINGFTQSSALSSPEQDDASVREIALLPPASPHEINVRFHILSHEGISFSPNATRFELKSLPLDPSLRTVFLIHGWLDTMDSARFWWQPILTTTQLFNSQRSTDQTGYQVIFVDWSRGASSSYYFPAVANLRVAAAVVANTIKILIDDLRFEPSHIRLIGFSLGAHLAGFTGKLLTGRYKLAWITGLEPANALFEMSSPSGSIFRTDAHYVDIVHTSSGHVLQGFSKPGPLGDADFYVNGATGSRQSGCEEDMPFGAVGGFFSRRRPCAHDRSPLFFSTLTSTTDCHVLAFACESYERFRMGECSSCGTDGTDCRLFGFWNDVAADSWPSARDPSPSSKKFFFHASPLRSCLYHYVMSVRTAVMEAPAFGSIHISSITDGQRILRTFESNGSVHTLLSLRNPLDQVREVALHWDAGRDVIDRLLGSPFTGSLLVKSLTFSYISHMNQTMRETKSLKFCGLQKKTEVKTGERLIMTRCS